MEELALTPLNPIDASYSNQVVDSVVRSELVYRYGEDISKWAVLLPFTLNHTQTNNVLAMFDGQGDTYYRLGTTSGSSLTTTLILDFGKVLEIRGIILSAGLFAESTGGPTVQLTSYYSLDGENFTQIDSDTWATTGTLYVDHVSATRQVRAIKFSVNTNGANLTNRYCDIYQLMVIV